MTVLRQGTVAAEVHSPENRPDYGLIATTRLSDAGGLTQFGAYLQTLAPGTRSSTRHWHEREDEFLLMLDGTATVLENDGPHEIGPGDACCWPGGMPNAHAVENRSDRPCSYIIMGNRPGDDRCHYPELGRTQVDLGEDWWIEDDATGQRIKGGKRA